MTRLSKVGILVCIMILFTACKTNTNPFIIINFPDINTNLFLQGAKSRSEIEITNTTEAPKFESDQRIVLYGSGLITYRSFHVIYSNKQLIINSNRITTQTDQVSNYVLTVKGNVEKGFLRSFE